MDYDALVTTVLGKEGAPRYRRLGLVLVLVSVVALVSIVALPLFSTESTRDGETIEEESWTYYEMMDDRVVWEPILNRVNWSIVGFAALAVLGLVLLLESAGRVNLRDYMRWHSEVRATALYAIATVVAIVGLAGVASVWGFAFHPDEWTYMDARYAESISSPAAAVATVVGVLVVAGMLFMVAYSSHLAIYRGGLDRRARTLARLAVLVALVALAGFLALRLGSVYVVSSSFELGMAPGTVLWEGTEPVTALGLDLRAHVPDADSDIERLDLYVDLASWCLFLSTLAALAGAAGAAAMGRRGRSRRVLLGAVAPVAAVALSVAALALGGLAVAGVQAAAEGLSIPMSIQVVNVEGTAGGGLVAMLALGAVLLALSLVYARSLGRAAMLAAVGMTAPGAADAPGVKPLQRGTVVLLAVVVVAVVAASAGAYLLLGSGGFGGGGDGGSAAVDIDSLEEFSLTLDMDDYAQEGQTITYDLHVQFLDEHGGAGTTFFVDRVEVVLTWQDEPDQRNPLATYENQPDTFALGLDDDGDGDISLVDEGSNVHGEMGEVWLRWESPGWWIAWGNSSVEVRDTYTVSWDLGLKALVGMLEAGNLEAPRRPIAYTDNGNDYHLEVRVSGRVHGAD